MAYETVQIAMQDAFVARWQAIRPTWDLETRFAAQTRPFTPPDGESYLHVLFLDQGGANIAIGVLDEQHAFLDCNIFVPVPDQDDRELARIADDVHLAMRTMALPEGVDAKHVGFENLGVTEQGRLQGRVRMRLTYEAV